MVEIFSTVFINSDIYILCTLGNQFSRLVVGMACGLLNEEQTSWGRGWISHAKKDEGALLYLLGVRRSGLVQFFGYLALKGHSRSF